MDQLRMDQIQTASNHPANGGLYDALQLLDEAIQSLTVYESIEGYAELKVRLNKVRDLIDKYLKNPDYHSSLGLTFGTVGSNKRLTEAEDELKRTKAELSRTNADLVSTRDKLDRTKRALDRIEEELSKTKIRLNKAEDDATAALRESKENKRQLDILEQKNKALADEVNNLKDRILETDVKVANLTNSTTKNTDKQTIGDFAYQIQKILGWIFSKNPKTWMTGGQLIRFYKNEATHDQKEKFFLIGLKEKKDIKKLAADLDSIKDNRFETGHYAIDRKLPMTINQLKTIARKEHLEDPVSTLVNVWNATIANGSPFDEETWELKKPFVRDELICKLNQVMTLKY